MTIKQVSVFVSNTPGSLTEITKMLAAHHIDIRALSIADTADFGILRLIVNKPDEAIELLRGEGIVVSITDVLAVQLDDQPGSLSGVLDILSEAQISIEYLYAFVTRRSDGAYVVLRVEDCEAANDVLVKNGISLASPEDIYAM